MIVLAGDVRLDLTPCEDAAVSRDGAQLAAGKGRGHGDLPLDDVRARIADDFLAVLGV